MSEQVNVKDLEVFTRFRAAMLKFAQTADQSIAAADSQIARTRSWLEGEQANYWQGQLRKRTEAVTKARDAVRQKKLYKDFTGRNRDALEEEKELAKCIAAVEEANHKIEAIKRWLPRLEKEAGNFRGGVSQLVRAITGDVPKAVSLLDRLAISLDQYMQIETPAGGVAAPSDGTGYEGSVSRGGEMAAEPPPAPSAPPTKTDQPEPQKESGHVADGQ